MDCDTGNMANQPPVPGEPPVVAPEATTARSGDVAGKIAPPGSSNTCWNLRVSAEADKGGRKYMEDVALVDFRRENNIEYAVFGVFDGHLRVSKI